MKVDQLINKGVALVLAAMAASAGATEGGTSMYPVGSEAYTCCALPPPGTYGMLYYQNYQANKAVDNAGKTVTPDGFKVRANAVVPRFIWVPKETVLGASPVVHAIVPIVNLDVAVAPGLSQSKTGVGDITVGAGLGWHHNENVHSLLAFDLFMPTGSYRKENLANIGKNHWAIAPVAGLSYIQKSGLNADMQHMVIFNGRNSDTDYKSGVEWVMDYALGWGMGNGWTVGVGGYWYQQLTNDKQHGASLPGSKGRTLAIGPAIRYDSGKGWFFTAKYETETQVRNRSDGRSFWLRGVYSF
ncbi:MULTISPECIES: SphA family protein [Comamonas]|uniref:SphA family protein n=1 Tax=Comamonas TaxID=283 RepID=UPI0011E72EAC|nr:MULTISPECIES: transporter [Comamonas]TYK73378.1 hypothetical protein FSY59_01755 [Comamonas sp. Z3]